MILTDTDRSTGNTVILHGNKVHYERGVLSFAIYRIFSYLIRTSFCRFLKRKKKLVRASNPHLSFNRPLRAAPSEVARWVSAAWKAIPKNIIVRSFKKCCISNALDGSEDDILWEDDGENKDDSDWVTDNDSVMSDDGESDE